MTKLNHFAIKEMFKIAHLVEILNREKKSAKYKIGMSFRNKL